MNEFKMNMRTKRIFDLDAASQHKGSELVNTIDTSRCPICHELNVCAIEKAKATGTKSERCWCMDAVFTPAVMDQVPEQARGKVCICAKCASHE